MWYVWLQSSQGHTMKQFMDIFSLPEMTLLSCVNEYFLKNNIDYEPVHLYKDVKVLGYPSVTVIHITEFPSAWCLLAVFYFNSHNTRSSGIGFYFLMHIPHGYFFTAKSHNPSGQK